MILTFWGRAEEIGGQADIALALKAAEERRAACEGGPATERAEADAALAKLRLLSGDAAGAVTAARVAHEVLMGERGRMDRSTRTAEALLGHALLALGRLDEAEAIERASIAGAKQAGDTAAAARATANLAELQLLRGNRAEAEASYRAALAGLEGDPASHGIVRNNLSAVLAETGRYRESDAELDLAIEELRAAHGDDHPHVRHARLNQAVSRAIAGQALNAMAALGDTDKRLTAALGPDHPSALVARAVRALVDAGLGRKHASAEAQAVLDLLRAKLGPNHPQLLRVESWITDTIDGNVLREKDTASERLAKITRSAERASERGEHDRAIAVFESTAAEFERAGAADAAIVALSLKVKALARAGQHDRMRAELFRSRALAESIHDQARLVEIGHVLEAVEAHVKGALQARIVAAQETLRGGGGDAGTPERVAASFAALDELGGIAREAVEQELLLTAAAALVILGKTYLSLERRDLAVPHLEEAKTHCARAGAIDLLAQIDGLLA